MRETMMDRIILEKLKSMETKLNQLIDIMMERNMSYLSTDRIDEVKRDGDGKPLDIHGNQWEGNPDYDGSENH